MDTLEGPSLGKTEVPHTGTTIVACTFKGGVVFGADGRVSVGNYISNRASNKIAPLSEYVYLLRSGSAPDTQIVSDHVSFYISHLEAELQGPVPVETAAHLVRTLNYENKESLVGALLVAGFDKAAGEGYVFGCPIGGTLTQEKWAIDGSGSTFIWGFCDAAYRENFTREEAEAFVIEALALAMATDSSSGGCLRIHTLDKDGKHSRFIKHDDLPFQETVSDIAAVAAGMAGMVVG